MQAKKRITIILLFLFCLHLLFIIKFSYCSSFISEIGANFSFIEITLNNKLDNYLNQNEIKKIEINGNKVNFSRIYQNNISKFIFIRMKGWNESKNSYSCSKEFNCTIINLFLNRTINLTKSFKLELILHNNENFIFEITNKSLLQNISSLKNTNRSFSKNCSNCKYYITNINQCKTYKNEDLINTNFSNSSYKDELKLKNISLDISISQKNKKIQFKIKSNISDYDYDFYYTYWIVDSKNNIVKNKKNSTNFNTKFWTPKNIFYGKYKFIIEFNYKKKQIKREIKFSKNFTFVNFEYNLNPHFDKILEILNKTSEEKESNNKTGDSKNTNPYIKISNKDWRDKNSLKFEINRGNSSKRTVIFYLNNKIIEKIMLYKYQKLKGELSTKKILELSKPGKNRLEISGFGKKISIDFNRNETNFEKTNNKSENNEYDNYEDEKTVLNFGKKLFDIINIYQDKKRFYILLLNKNKKNINYKCFFKNNDLNLEIFDSTKGINFRDDETNLELSIGEIKNNSRFIFEDKKIKNVTLICKYKKNNNYYYKKKSFIIKKIDIDNEQTKINQSTEIVIKKSNEQVLSKKRSNTERLGNISLSIKKNLNKQKFLKNQNSTKSLSTGATKETLEIKSQIYKNKNIAIMIFLSVLVIITSVLLIKF